MHLITLANRSALVHRAATSAFGTYAAYIAHGIAHPSLFTPNRTPTDDKALLPGDEIVPDPTWTADFSTVVRALPEDVWPWIVQIGYGRAGWYTWYPLDNGGVASADVIVPELQRLAVGDVIPDGPRAREGFGIWRVRALQPRYAMVLFSRRELMTGHEIPEADLTSPSIGCSWAFVLNRIDPLTTRVHVRVRANLQTGGNPLTTRLARWFFGLGDTVMENTMLEGIRQRVEQRFS